MQEMPPVEAIVEVKPEVIKAEPKTEAAGEQVAIVEEEIDEDKERPGVFPLLIETIDDDDIEINEARRSSFFIGQQDNNVDDIPYLIIDSTNRQVRPDDIVTPPDGGWGWAIVIAAFLSNLMADGYIYSSGILLSAIVEQDNSKHITKTEASWVLGVLIGFNLLSGPFVSLLANAVGFRTCAILGSLISSAGYILTFIICRNGVPNLIALFICYGFISGVGFGFIYVPAVIAVGFYFQKRRALATGIAVCGSGIGTFIYAPATGYMIKLYGWQWTVLILGLMLNISIGFGMLYRPLTVKKHIEPEVNKIPGEVRKASSTLDGPRLDSSSALRILMAAESITKIEQEAAEEEVEIRFQNSKEEIISGGNKTISTIVEIKDETITNETDDKTKTKEEKKVSISSAKNESQLSIESIKHSSSFNQIKNVTSKRNILGNAALYSPCVSQQRTNSIDSVTDNSEHIADGQQSNLRRLSAVSGGFPGNESRRNSSIISTSGTRKVLRLKSALVEAEDDETGVEGQESKAITLLLPDSTDDLNESSRVFRVQNKDTLNSPFNVSSIFYQGALSNITYFDEREEGYAWEAVPVDLATMDLENEKLTAISAEEHKLKKFITFSWIFPKCCFTFLHKMLDSSLLRSRTFLLLAFSGAINTLGFFIPFLFLAAHAKELPNFSKQNSTESQCGEYECRFQEADASLLVAVIGISNTVCRILIGGIADNFKENILLANNIALTIGGVITILLPFFKADFLMYVYSVVFGFSAACYVSLRSVILVQLLGIDKLTNAFGLLLLFQGLSALLGSPIAGYLREISGNYDVSFYVAGTLIATSAVLLYPLSMIHKIETKRKLKTGENPISV